MNTRTTHKPSASKIVDINLAKPKPHREVEAYVAFPIGEELRARLETFVNEHLEQGEEDLFAMLLDLGLRMANDGAELERAVDGVVDGDEDEEPEHGRRNPRLAARRRLLLAATAHAHR
jgi:hypothetical protein